MRVAVGISAGQPQGLRRVVTKLQSSYSHSFRHPRFCMVLVAVGQTSGLGHWATTRLTSPRTMANFMATVVCWGRILACAVMARYKKKKKKMI